MPSAVPRTDQVVTRIAVWLPQALIAMMFASLAQSENHHRTARQASAVVLALGGVLTLGTWATGPLVVTVFGGAKYHELDETIWLFTLLGSLLAMLQLSMLAGLARRTARRAVLLWTTIAADIAVVLATGQDMTPTRLVGTLACLAAAATALALWLTVRRPPAGTVPPPATEGVGS